MAGMFYSLQEAADKLKVAGERVQELVKEGKLREFRDGANVLFKVDEVEALMFDTSITESKEDTAVPEVGIDTDEMSLAPEAGENLAGETPAGLAAETPGDLAGETPAGLPAETPGDVLAADEFMDADSFAGAEQADILGATDGSGVDDLMIDTKGSGAEASLEEIEEDVNLDTFGSGSGLLDLSLQADDTSLGGILDEIYTAEDGQETAEGQALDMMPEPDVEPMLPGQAEEMAEPEPAPEPPVMAATYAEPAPDTVSNALGWMLFLPLLAVVYTAIVATAGFLGVMPGILDKLPGGSPGSVHVVWYGMGGLAVLALVVVGGASMLGGGGGVKTAKLAKAKKPKKPKKKK